MANVPHLLLAAGGSRRMGQPKQLLRWGNQTLIEHQIDIRLQTGQPVAIVLGAYSDLILPVIEPLPVTIFINNEWVNGMGNSIAFGINMCRNTFPLMDGVLISLIDQPLVTRSHLENMLCSFQPGAKQMIVSQSESGWKGVPALFDSFYFDELQNLDGEDGARNIIRSHRENVKSIECDDQLEDIDTPEDYRQLLR